MGKFYDNLADKTIDVFKPLTDPTLRTIFIILLCIAVACIITAIVLIIMRCRKKKSAPATATTAEVAAPADSAPQTEAVAAPVEPVAEQTSETSAISDSDLPWEYIRKVIVPGEVVEPATKEQPAPAVEAEPESTATVSVDSPQGKVKVSVSGTNSQVNELLSGKTMIVFAHDINFNMGGGICATPVAPVAKEAPAVEPVIEKVAPAAVEEPAVEEPVAEEVVEEPAVKEVVEEPVVEEPVVEEAVVEEPVVEDPIVATVDENADDEDDEDSDDEAFFGADGKRKTIRKSFTARLTLATVEKQEFYSKIKNELLRYKGVKCRRSFNGESFNKGRTQIAKIAIKGKTLSVYLGVLNMDDFIDTKYHFEDVSDTKKYADTPMKLKVKSNRGVGYVFELLSEIGKQLDLKYINNEEVSYLPEPATYAELVDLGEIRIYE